MEFGKKLAIPSKNNLIVKLYIVKNIWKWKKNQPKEGFHCIYTSVILIDSVYRKDKNCYPQVILEKYYFVIIEKKMSNFNDKKFILLILTL